MQSEFCGAGWFARVAFAPFAGFAAPAQMVVGRDPSSSRRGRSTLHGVVFDFFANSPVRDGT
jgi:hypothetical protein